MIDIGGALSDIETGLRARAEMLRSAGAAPLQALDRSGWQGRRADDLRQRLQQRLAVLEAIARDCDRAAGTAHDLVSGFDDGLRRMHRLEDEVRSWMRHAGPELLVKLPWSSQSLPDRGSPEWAHVAHVMHGLGGVL